MGDVVIPPQAHQLRPSKDGAGTMAPGAQEWSLNVGRRAPSRCSRNPHGIARPGDCAGPAGLEVASPSLGGLLRLLGGRVQRADDGLWLCHHGGCMGGERS
jgi:hypothetical protein